MVASVVLYLIPYLLGALAVIALIGVIGNARQAANAPYFRIRREASRQSWRWFLILLASLAGIGLSIAAKRFVPPTALVALVAPRPTATSTLPPSMTVTGPSPLIQTPLDIPPSITATQPPPTLTPTPLIVTIQSVVTPPADAALRITAISSGISPSLTPINPGSAFPAGTPRIYFWVEFSGMMNGLSWSRVLLLNGSVIRSESEAWERGPEGLAYYWFDAQGGWPAGNYEVQLYLGDRLVASQTFTVIN